MANYLWSDSIFICIFYLISTYSSWAHVRKCATSLILTFSLLSALLPLSYLFFFFFLSTESHFLESQSSRMKKSILAKKINSLPRSYLEKSTQDDSFFLLISRSLEGPVWGKKKKKEYYIPDNPSPLLLLYNTLYLSKCMQRKKKIWSQALCVTLRRLRISSPAFSI